MEIQKQVRNCRVYQSSILFHLVYFLSALLLLHFLAVLDSKDVLTFTNLPAIFKHFLGISLQLDLPPASCSFNAASYSASLLSRTPGISSAGLLLHKSLSQFGPREWTASCLFAAACVLNSQAVISYLVSESLGSGSALGR